MNWDQPQESDKDIAKTPESKIKEGVDFVFEQNPKLAQFGTKEQYSEYLGSIFPGSVEHNILYRGDNINFSLPTNNNIGVYLTLNKRYASQYGDRVTMALIEIKNPYHIKDMPNIYWKRIIDKSDRLSVYDSVVLNNGEEFIVGPNQIHILGSNQDLENFKHFVSKTKD